MEKQAAMVLAFVAGTAACGTTSSTSSSSANVTDPADGGAAGDCTLFSAADSAKAALASGASTVFVDCAKKVRYTRKSGADGALASETIEDAVTGARAEWTYAPEKATLRVFSSANANTPLHTIEATSSGGQVTFVSTDDTDGNDVPDQRTTWVVDPKSATMPITVEADASETGSWSIVSSGVAPSDWDEALFDDTANSPMDCGAHKDEIRAAYEAALEQGLSCLNGIGESTMRLGLERLLVRGNVTFLCDPKLESFAQFQRLPPNVLNIFDEYAVKIGPPTFAKDRPAGLSLASIIFHELGHAFLGGHPRARGNKEEFKDPDDRVFNCQAACFGMPESQNGPIHRKDSKACAACIGAKNGDPRCKDYPQVGCHYCGCPRIQKWYADELTCAKECPTGMDCFNYICTRDPAASCR